MSNGKSDNDVKDAINEAIKKSQEAAARKLQQMGGGLGGLLGGMGQ
jgi:DNA-binding protein YbaB